MHPTADFHPPSTSPIKSGRLRPHAVALAVATLALAGCATSPGYGGGGQKHIDQHIVELSQKAAQRPPGMNLRQEVWTMTGQTGSRFGRGKPGLGHAKAFKARTEGPGMGQTGRLEGRSGW